MKKIVLILGIILGVGFVSVVALVTVLFVLGDEEEPVQTANVTVQEQKAFTLLVYVVGSDLESDGGYASDDLQEILSATLSDDVNVIVQTGGTTQWQTDGFDADQLQRWQLVDGQWVQVAALDLQSMGKARTLSDFVQFGTNYFPADSYGLILWDHGGGSISGVGFDENYDFDGLQLPELHTALATAYKTMQQKFTFIGFDACLMGNIETAQTVAPYAEYMIGSEELEPGHGWNYTAILNYLALKPTSTGAQIGETIVKSFAQQAKKEETSDSITLSVVNLQEVAKLTPLLNDWAAKVQAGFTSNNAFATFAKLRSKSQAFGRGAKPKDQTDMADLGDLFRKTATLYPKESKAALAQLHKVVVTSLTSEIAPEATGLSIYFPYYNTKEFSKNIKRFHKLSMPAEYEQLISTFADGLLKKTSFNLDNSELSTTTNEKNELVTQFTIPKKQRDDVVEIYSVLGQYVNKQETKSIVLGMDNLIDYNEKTGVASAQWDGLWVTLGGQFISMNLLQDYDDYSLYAIPAVVNDVDVDLYVLFDYETGLYKLMGAWEGIDETVGFVDRDVTPLHKGDQIVPLLETYDEKSGDTTYEEGDAMTYDAKKTKIELTELPAGSYTFGFALEDFAGNVTYTDFDVYDVSDN